MMNAVVDTLDTASEGHTDLMRERFFATGGVAIQAKHTDGESLSTSSSTSLIVTTRPIGSKAAGRFRVLMTCARRFPLA